MAHVRDGVEADVCSQCHGVWFSRPALEACVRKFSANAALPTAPVLLRASPLLQRLPCPACQPDRLVTHRHDGTEVDSCPRCHGVWLDQGEMEQILRLHRARAGSEKNSAFNKSASSNATGPTNSGLVDGPGFLGDFGEVGFSVVGFLDGLF
jgi:Zn-finger nucleic acid-binding protein